MNRLVQFGRLLWKVLKMSKFPEQKVRDEVVALLKKRNIWHFVYPASVTYGIPDIIAIVNGFFVGLELKRPGMYSVTELQKVILDKIRRSGGYAAIVESAKDAEKFIDEIPSVYLFKS